MSCEYPALGNWGGRRPEDAGSDTVGVQRAEQLAWSTLLGMTAGRVTLCPITVRPICPRCVGSDTWITAPAGAYGMNGSLARLPQDVLFEVSILAGGWGPDDLCGGVAGRHKVLPLERPVGKVVSVEIDGAPLERSAWTVRDGALVRLDGGLWPLHQKLDVPAGGPGSFEVTYYRGLKPGGLLVWAAGQLAAEFYTALAPVAAGSKAPKCRLPDGVQRVVRQGVTYEIGVDAFEGNITGIREIDAVIRRYNPHGLAQQTVIASVDSLRRSPRQVG